MSSISFPHGLPDHVPSSSNDTESGNNDHSHQFFGNSFVDAGASGFQMNPLSSHPPRTPRASRVSGTSQVYGTSIYEPTEAGTQAGEMTAEEEEEEAEVVKETAIPRRVRTEDVWREMVATSYGRDKTFKLVQYSLKLYLLFHGAVTTSRIVRSTRPSWEEGLLKRLSSTTSGLSFARKCLILFNWLPPLTNIIARHAESAPYLSEKGKGGQGKKKPFMHTLLNSPPPVLLELANAVADDMYTLSLLGLLGTKSGSRAARFADWCWFLSTLANLVENTVERSILGNLEREVESRMYAETMSNGAIKTKPSAKQSDERELSRLRQKDYWLQVSRAKLIMDLIFVIFTLNPRTDASPFMRSIHHLSTHASLVHSCMLLTISLAAATASSFLPIYLHPQGSPLPSPHSPLPSPHSPLPPLHLFSIQ